MSPTPDNRSLMRSLGEFVGHIWRGVTTPVGAPPERGDSSGDSGPPGCRRREIGREVEECEAEPGPQGERVILRRTTIDEVEVRPPRSAEESERARRRGKAE